MFWERTELPREINVRRWTCGARSTIAMARPEMAKVALRDLGTFQFEVPGVCKEGNKRKERNDGRADGRRDETKSAGRYEANEKKSYLLPCE